MTISLSDAGKRFNREWIFRHLTYQFEEGQSYAIIGPNGSGKSTLLQAISGGMYISEGKMKHEVGSQRSEVRSQKSVGSLQSAVSSELVELAHDQVYRHVSICAPYLEVVEEMTVKEFLSFHKEFKPFLKGLSIDAIISIVGLEKAVNKQIRYYSSGMKQRVRLAQCIFSDTDAVLLDEPCTNLDLPGIELYHRLINEYCKDRLVVVSSNDEVEYKFCTKKILISDYK